MHRSDRRLRATDAALHHEDGAQAAGCVEVTAIEGPFERFGLCWRFRALADAVCEAALAGGIELRPALLNMLFAAHLAGKLEAMLAAFEARARRQLGPALPVDADQRARLAG